MRSHTNKATTTHELFMEKASHLHVSAKEVEDPGGESKQSAGVAEEKEPQGSDEEVVESCGDGSTEDAIGPAIAFFESRPFNAVLDRFVAEHRGAFQVASTTLPESDRLVTRAHAHTRA